MDTQKWTNELVRRIDAYRNAAANALTNHHANLGAVLACERLLASLRAETASTERESVSADKETQ